MSGPGSLPVSAVGADGRPPPASGWTGISSGSSGRVVGDVGGPSSGVGPAAVVDVVAWSAVVVVVGRRRRRVVVVVDPSSQSAAAVTPGWRAAVVVAPGPVVVVAPPGTVVVVAGLPGPSGTEVEVVV
jgi:hypothetical protein